MIYVKSLLAGLGAAVLMAVLIIALCAYPSSQINLTALRSYPPLWIGVVLGFLVGSYLTYRWLR
jgi:hypothetical protein